LDLFNPAIDAFVDFVSRQQAPEVQAELRADNVVSLAGFLPLMPRLDDLFGAQGNEDADDDDSDFAGKNAPSVHRFRKFEVHPVAP
jgi:hypothetical protein